MPGGKALYRFLQAKISLPRIDLKRSLVLFKPELEAMRTQIGFKDRDFMESGTGWSMLLPILLIGMGARKVESFDLNPWLNRDSLLKSLAFLLGNRSELLKVLTEDEFQTFAWNKLESLKKELEQNENFRQALKEFSIHYHQPADASKANLPDKSIDCVYSSKVLEHISKGIIESIVTEASRLLRPTGVQVHHITPSDHFLVKDGHGINFLKYSADAWKYLGGSGLAYHNRMRPKDYEEIFIASDLDVIKKSIDVNPKALNKLQAGFEVNREYADYPKDCLAADRVTYLIANRQRSQSNLGSQIL